MLGMNQPNVHCIDFTPPCERSETIQITHAASANGRYVRHEIQSNNTSMDMNVPCVPLHLVLEDAFARHRIHVNFFVLDMNGPEDAVLNTINFNKV